MTLRVVDSGLREPRAHLSLTEALCRGRAAGTSPDTLRFQRFPPSALVGRHQILAREVDLDWCAAHGVRTARRMTGGGAIVMGPGLLGWELVLSRRLVPPTLDGAAALLCGAVAEGLRGFGIDAAFRPRNDIEVEGRKLCGTGGYVAGEVLVFQGTVLAELDLGLMMGALRLPARKLGRRGLEAMAERVTDLRMLLGAAPPMAAVQDAVAGALARSLRLPTVNGVLAEGERDMAGAIEADEIGTEAFVRGEDIALAAPGRVVTHVTETAGGTIEVVLKLRDGTDRVVEQALVAGDFFAAPPDAVMSLEAALRGCPAMGLADRARAVLDAAEARFLGASPEVMVAAIAGAAREALEATP